MNPFPPASGSQSFSAKPMAVPDGHQQYGAKPMQLGPTQSTMPMQIPQAGGQFSAGGGDPQTFGTKPMQFPPTAGATPGFSAGGGEAFSPRPMTVSAPGFSAGGGEPYPQPAAPPPTGGGEDAYGQFLGNFSTQPMRLDGGFGPQLPGTPVGQPGNNTSIVNGRLAIGGVPLGNPSAFQRPTITDPNVNQSVRNSAIGDGFSGVRDGFLYAGGQRMMPQTGSPAEDQATLAQFGVGSPGGGAGSGGGGFGIPKAGGGGGGPALNPQPQRIGGQGGPPSTNYGSLAPSTQAYMRPPPQGLGGGYPSMPMGGMDRQGGVGGKGPDATDLSLRLPPGMSSQDWDAQQLAQNPFGGQQISNPWGPMPMGGMDRQGGIDNYRSSLPMGGADYQSGGGGRRNSIIDALMRQYGNRRN